MNLSIFEEIYAPVFSSPPRGADQSNPWVKKTLFSTEFLSKPSKDFIGRRGFLVGKDAMDAGVFAAKVQIRAAFKKGGEWVSGVWIFWYAFVEICLPKKRCICTIPRKVREYTTYAHIGVFIFVYDDHASLFLC